MSNDMVLSAKGLKNDAISQLPDDFIFKVGDKIYRCNSFFADFISSKISLLHCEDPTLNTFVIDYDDKFNVFGKIMTLLKGGTITFEAHEKKALRYFGRVLGNHEIVSFFSCYGENVPINIENAISLVEEKYEMDLNISEEVAFIANNFSSIDTKYFNGINIDILEQILQHPDLLLVSEDSLSLLLINLSENYDKEYSRLFNYLIFNQMSPDIVIKCLELVGYKSLNQQLFDTLIESFDMSRELTTKLDKRYYKRVLNFPFKDLHDMGIVNYLRSLYNINPHITKLMRVTSPKESLYPPYNVLNNVNSKVFFQINNKDVNYLLFDFRKRRVIIDSFSFLMSNNTKEKEYYNVGFLLEGSVDNKTYYSFEYQDKIDIMNGSSYLCRIGNTKEVRYIKFTVTTDVSDFNIYSFEFFGQLVEYAKTTS